MDLCKLIRLFSEEIAWIRCIQFLNWAKYTIRQIFLTAKYCLWLIVYCYQNFGTDQTQTRLLMRVKCKMTLSQNSGVVTCQWKPTTYLKAGKKHMNTVGYHLWTSAGSQHQVSAWTECELVPSNNFTGLRGGDWESSYHI